MKLLKNKTYQELIQTIDKLRKHKERLQDKLFTQGGQADIS